MHHCLHRVDDRLRSDFAVKERDPGLQIERTELAWRRTGLCFAANALLVSRLAITSGSGLLAGAAASMLSGALFCFVRSHLNSAPRPFAPIVAINRVAMKGCVGLILLACALVVAKALAVHLLIIQK